MRQTFSLLRNNMDVSKEKITNRKELEEALSFVIVDDWLSFPYDKSLTLDEKIEYLYRTLFGDNHDENDPKFKEFDTGIKLFREELKKEEDSYRL